MVNWIRMPDIRLAGFANSDRAEIETGIPGQSSKSARAGWHSVRQHNRHLNPAARAQDLQRHLVAVAAYPEIDG